MVESAPPEPVVGPPLVVLVVLLSVLVALPVLVVTTGLVVLLLPTVGPALVLLPPPVPPTVLGLVEVDVLPSPVLMSLPVLTSSAGGASSTTLAQFARARPLARLQRIMCGGFTRSSPMPRGQ